jgi:hypothetical protein
MIFLIEYSRREGRIVSTKAFEDAKRPEAEDLRLELEVVLNREGLEREVVLLDATDERALRRTHRRYFEEISELARSTARED